MDLVESSQVDSHSAFSDFGAGGSNLFLLYLSPTTYTSSWGV